MEKETMVPYIVHEGVMARMERTIRRLWVLCIIMFLAFIVSNGLWLYYESQWETVETTEQTVTQDIDTRNGGLIVTGIGDIYGEDTSNIDEENN